MDWSTYLTAQANSTYKATSGLLDLVDGDKLDWKPTTGGNWMTTGQLLKHLETACGFCCRGFSTGEWGMPDGAEMSEEDMLPSADRMETSAGIEATRAALKADHELCLKLIAETSNGDFANRKVPAPWNPTEQPLGFQYQMSIDHLASHRSQLFYYLKLQGKPVHTGNLWGM